MRLAIMQPYFIPYAGYFRLFQSTDLLVIYDCVQFTRRGWIHRNQLFNWQGIPTWLTLPLTKAPQEVKIADLTFARDALQRLQEQSLKFPLFSMPNFLATDLSVMLFNFSLPPIDYLLASLRMICSQLEIPFNIVKSSDLHLSPDLKGQDRILAIAKHYHAKVYVNASGGRDLYQEQAFLQENIKLKFLADYQGSKQSILARLFTENVAILREEIISQSA